MKWNYQKVAVALGTDDEVTPGQLTDLVFDADGRTQSGRIPTAGREPTPAEAARRRRRPAGGGPRGPVSRR